MRTKAQVINDYIAEEVEAWVEYYGEKPNREQRANIRLNAEYEVACEWADYADRAQADYDDSYPSLHDVQGWER